MASLPPTRPASKQLGRDPTVTTAREQAPDCWTGPLGRQIARRHWRSAWVVSPVFPDVQARRTHDEGIRSYRKPEPNNNQPLAGDTFSSMPGPPEESGIQSLVPGGTGMSLWILSPSVPAIASSTLAYGKGLRWPPGRRAGGSPTQRLEGSDREMLRPDTSVFHLRLRGRRPVARSGGRHRMTVPDDQSCPRTLGRVKGIFFLSH